MLIESAEIVHEQDMHIDSSYLISETIFSNRFFSQTLVCSGNFITHCNCQLSTDVQIHPPITPPVAHCCMRCAKCTSQPHKLIGSCWDKYVWGGRGNCSRQIYTHVCEITLKMCNWRFLTTPACCQFELTFTNMICNFLSRDKNVSKSTPPMWAGWS